jgi:hypothetical protein
MKLTLLSGYGIKVFCFLPELLLTLCGHFSFIVFIFGRGSDTFSGPNLGHGVE